MNRWIWFVTWFVTIFAGEGINEFFIPADWKYLFGFVIGTFSFMFLRLFSDKKE